MLAGPRETPSTTPRHEGTVSFLHALHIGGSRVTFLQQERRGTAMETMNRRRSNYAASESSIRIGLVSRLRERAGEIEDALYALVSSLCAEIVQDGEDPEFLLGCRAAIAGLVQATLTCIEQPADQFAPLIPLEAATQARRAARKGVDPGIVIRRYVAGERLIAKFVMDEGGNFPPQELWKILVGQAAHFDVLLEAVISEYNDELGRIEGFPQQRLRRNVDGLLAGHSFGRAPDLGYDLDAWHLGLVLTGFHPEVAAGSLATAVGRQALVVPRDEGVAWAWLGGGQSCSSPTSNGSSTRGCRRTSRSRSASRARGLRNGG